MFIMENIEEEVDGSSGIGAGFVPCYGNYCGPGHPSNTRHELEPVDELDHICEMHDAAYEMGIDRKIADGAMANDLAKIDAPASVWGQLYMSLADKYMDAAGADHKEGLMEIMEKAAAAKNPDRVLRKELRAAGLSAQAVREIAPVTRELMTYSPTTSPKSPGILLHSENNNGGKGGRKRRGKGKGKRPRGKTGKRTIRKFKKYQRKGRQQLRSTIRDMSIAENSARMLRPLKELPLKGKKEGKRIIGTDLLFQLSTSSTPANHDMGSVLLQVPLAPSHSSWANTRLKQFLPLYQKFKFRKAALRYYPIANKTVSGQLLMYIDRDPTVSYAGVADTLAALQVSMARTGMRPTQVFEEHSALFRPDDDPYKTYYNYPAIAGTTDPRLYQQGSILVFAASNLPDSEAMGTFVIEYDIEFYDNAVLNDVVSSAQTGNGTTAGYGPHVCTIKTVPTHSHSFTGSANPTPVDLFIGGNENDYNTNVVQTYKSPAAQGVGVTVSATSDLVEVGPWPTTGANFSWYTEVANESGAALITLWNGPFWTWTATNATIDTQVNSWYISASGKSMTIVTSVKLSGITMGAKWQLVCSTDMGTMAGISAPMNSQMIICADMPLATALPKLAHGFNGECAYEARSVCMNGTHCQLGGFSEKNNCFVRRGVACEWCGKELEKFRKHKIEEEREKAASAGTSLLKMFEQMLRDTTWREEIPKKKEELHEKHFEDLAGKRRERALKKCTKAMLDVSDVIRIKKALDLATELSDEDESLANMAKILKGLLTEKKNPSKT